MDWGMRSRAIIVDFEAVLIEKPFYVKLPFYYQPCNVIFAASVFRGIDVLVGSFFDSIRCCSQLPKKNSKIGHYDLNFGKFSPSIQWDKVQAMGSSHNSVFSQNSCTALKSISGISQLFEQQDAKRVSWGIATSNNGSRLHISYRFVGNNAQYS